MALAFFFGEVSHRDGRAAARFVDHLHALGNKFFFLQHFSDGTGEEIRAAARAGVDHSFNYVCSV